MSDLEKAVLATINETGCIANSLDFAEQHAVDHKAVIGVIKSLEQYEMVIAKVSHPIAGCCQPSWSTAQKLTGVACWALLACQPQAQTYNSQSVHHGAWPAG